MTLNATAFAQTYFHGGKADLKVGNLICPGFASNFGQRKTAAFVYLTATLDAAIWGAELALGEGAGRIWVAEPTGPIEDDPNLTDAKFPGNPTMSYRTKGPLRVLGDVVGWHGHPAEQLAAMREGVARAARLGIEAVQD